MKPVTCSTARRRSPQIVGLTLSTYIRHELIRTNYMTLGGFYYHICLSGLQPETDIWKKNWRVQKIKNKGKENNLEAIDELMCKKTKNFLHQTISLNKNKKKIIPKILRISWTFCSVGLCSLGWTFFSYFMSRGIQILPDLNSLKHCWEINKPHIVYIYPAVASNTG